MLPETLDHLKAHGYARGEAQADREKLADGLLDLVTQQPVVGDDQIQSAARLVAELRFQILGGDSPEVEQELDGIVAPLTGPEGLVQQLLLERQLGLVLCSAWVTRRLSNNGAGEITIKRPGRFVTADADLIDTYYLQPQHRRTVNDAAHLKNRYELAISQQPALAARYQEQIARTYEQIALELPRARNAA